jgi:threonyl-tRNA synthetase
LACGKREVEERSVSIRRLGQKQTSTSTLEEIVNSLTIEAKAPDQL